MANYFRITAYHPQENLSAIIDCNGMFEKLWQFSSFIVKHGFKVLEAADDSKFDFGDLPKASLPNPTRSSCDAATAICPSLLATSSRWLGNGITKIKSDSCNRIRLISDRTPGLAEIFNIDSRSYFAIKREQIYRFGD